MREQSYTSTPLNKRSWVHLSRGEAEFCIETRTLRFRLGRSDMDTATFSLFLEVRNATVTRRHRCRRFPVFYTAGLLRFPVRDRTSSRPTSPSSSVGPMIPPQSYRRPTPRPRLILTPLDAASSLHPWLQVEAVCLRHPSVRAAARCCCFTLSAHRCYQLCLSPICLVSYFVLPALFIFIERKLHTVSVTFKTWL